MEERLSGRTQLSGIFHRDRDWPITCINRCIKDELTVISAPQVFDDTKQALLREGLTHHREGRLDEARQLYYRLLASEPGHADCLHLLGMTFFQAGNADEAIGLIRSAIAFHPLGASYHANLGNILQSLEKDAEAEACYRASLSIRPNQAEVWMNLGHVLKKRGRPEASLHCYEQALRIDPQMNEAKAGMGTSLLLQGKFLRGWKLSESRWQTRDWSDRPRIESSPRWHGENLGSNRVLIWGEQGVGDEIMFAGLVPDILATGTRCVLACEPRLGPLFARSFPGAEVVSLHNPGQSLESDIAAQIPSGSLPGLFRKTAADFGHTTSPYLTSNLAVRDHFRNKYKDGRPLVGVAWHTKNQASGRARSIKLASLAPLFANHDVRWISLQYGNHEALQAEVAASADPVFLDDDVDQLQDMDLFAAQVAAMDLVVTIDNSTAHLAAALGVPTWVMLPYAPDWRWLLKRQDSPWYPTLRLFRAEEPGKWTPVVERVCSELRATFPLI
ncbi:MAG: tetratricopeptide repeat-containing glycosyltransferase family protein [Acidobacteriaceae bacterium]